MMIRSNLEIRVPDGWLNESADSDANSQNMQVAANTDAAAAPAQDADGDQLDALREMLKREEGYRKDVYLDSRNIPTVGIGHKVVPSDNLKLGDRIDDARVNQFFAKDALGAINAANAQAAQAGISDPDFIRRLAAVDFQVGQSWRVPFAQTWGKIVGGDYAGAAENLGRSLWAKQTPRPRQEIPASVTCLATKEWSVISFIRMGYLMTAHFSGRGALLGLVALASALASGPSNAAAKLGVYCINEKPGLQVFADKLLPNGDLSFGLSIWYPEGQHIGLFGVAGRRGDHWEYLENMTAPNPEDRCKVRISSRPDGTPLLVGDAIARCKPDGGVGTEIGTLQFPVSAYEGPVTNELSEIEYFFDHVGKCADK